MILQGATLLGGGALYFALKHWLPSYFDEKGKNLAQKQDIQELTEKIESVRQTFNVELEKVKAKLEQASHVSKFQFETEFEIYKNVWGRLVSLQHATFGLRPDMEVALEEGETSEDRKKKRAQVFADAYEVPPKRWTGGGEPEKENPSCPRNRKFLERPTIWSSRSKPCRW